MFIGEAEETWPGFLADWAAGHAAKRYEQEDKTDLSRVPAPRLDLIKMNRYAFGSIQFSRGCPFLCEFCDIIVVFGRKPRLKTAPQIIAELEGLRAQNQSFVFIVDDNLIGNKKAIKDVLHHVIDWQRNNGYPLRFVTEASLDLADDAELMALMAEAHIVAVFVGIESPNEDSLREARKLQNVRAGGMVEKVHRIQNAGMEVWAGMIVGFDNDDESIFEEQLRFIQDARIPVSMTGMLQAMPKTPLHDRMAKEGRLIAESTGDQFVFSNILPKAMTRVELYKGYRKLISELYEFRNFRIRTLEFILNRGRQVGEGLAIRREEVRLAARVLRDTVVAASPRRAWFTLSLLGTTLLKRPAALADAMAFAIVHKALYEYMQSLDRHLERAIGEIESSSDAMAAANA
jgi:radical SAM superfamily enzyme YgiQ (UPF0313 family)